VKPGRRTIAGHPALLVAGDHLFEILSPLIVTHAAHGDPVTQSRHLSPRQSIELRPIPEPDAAATSISATAASPSPSCGTGASQQGEEDDLLSKPGAPRISLPHVLTGDGRAASLDVVLLWSPEPPP
jgi:hypothetical protein